MNTSADEPWVLTDAIWRGWAHKSKVRAQRAARKRTMFAAVVLLGGAMLSLMLRVIWN